jgi:hypothetical protein
MNEKTEELHDFAYGLLPDSNDSEKTLSNLERNNINHFYIIRMHVLKVFLVMRK